MSTKEFIKRYILFMISLFLSALGVAITKHAGLGVAPVSSVANIIFSKYSFFSLGTWLMIWNILLLFGQIIILRKNFRLYNLLQIPLSITFGIFTDFSLWCISEIELDNYSSCIIAVFIGVCIRALGIALAITADIILNSSEAFVKAVSDTIKYKFGLIKVLFDIACVAVSVLISIIFFDGSIIGTREGTVISAIFTGIFVSLFLKLIHTPLTSILTQQKSKHNTMHKSMHKAIRKPIEKM